MTVQEDVAAQPPASGGDGLVVMRDVQKWFGKLHVLQDIDLTVKRGEVVVVIGPSGSMRAQLCSMRSSREKWAR